MFHDIFIDLYIENHRQKIVSIIIEEILILVIETSL